MTVAVRRCFETPILAKRATAAADTLQFWGAWNRHYAAKISLHNDFVEGVEAAVSAANQIVCGRHARRYSSHFHFLICSGNGHCAQSELSCRQKSS